MKQFDEEYKEYINAQVPDLWNRIETGVDQKISEQARTIKSKKKKRVKKQYRLIRFGASIAACIAALIIAIPVLHYVRMGRSNSEKIEKPELADITIENTQEMAREIEKDSGTADAVAAEKYADVTAGVTENKQMTVETEFEEEALQEVQQPEVTEEDQGTEGVQEAGELALAQSDLPDENEQTGSVVDEVTTQSETETIVAKVVGVYQNSATEATVYEIEVVGDGGKNLKAMQTLTITADTSMPLLEMDCEYTMSLQDIDMQNLTAALCEIIQ